MPGFGFGFDFIFGFGFGDVVGGPNIPPGEYGPGLVPAGCVGRGEFGAIVWDGCTF